MDRHPSAPTFPLGRRRFAAAAGLALVAGCLGLRDAAAQNVSVTNGDVLANGAPATYDSLTVSGTSAGGSPSTYDANAPHTINLDVQIYDSGVLNANASVTSGDQFSVYGNGVLNLASGTLSAPVLSLSGAGAVNQSGGNYSTSSLTLSGSGTLTYGTGDTLSSEVNVTQGSTLTLGRNLVLVDSIRLFDGGAVSRTTQTISANGFEVDDATLALIDGDTFDPNGSSAVFNGGIVDTVAGTSLGSLIVTGTNGAGASARLNVNGNTSANGWVDVVSGGVVNLASGTLTTTGLGLVGSGAAIQGGGHYAVETLSIGPDAGLTYGSGDSVSLNIDVYDGGTFTLDRDLTLAGYLSVAGPSAFVPSGHAYSVAELYLNDHAGLTYGAADAIAGGLTVAGTSTLTLDKNLELTGMLTLSSGGSIIRTTETVSAASFTVNEATFSLLATDTFAPTGFSGIYYGGVVDAAAGSSFGNLYVFGRNAADAPATLNVNGDVTAAGTVDVNGGGVLNLASGTFSAATLQLSGSGAAVQGGGRYALDSLSLASGAALTYGTGDSVSQSVIVYVGSTLTLARDLSLAGTLSLGGPAAFAPGTHHYSVNELYLEDNAAVTYRTGDSITYALSMTGSSTLTLQKDLALTGYVALYSGASLARTTETISAPGFYVGDAALAIRASDSFSPTGYSQIFNGGVVDAAAGSSFGMLWISGKNAADAPATLNVNGNVAAGAFVDASGGGVLNLTSGTFSTNSLSLSGSGALVQGGGNYAVNSLSVANGAAVTYGSGDSVSQNFSAYVGGTLTLARDLSLAGTLSLSGSTAFNPAGHDFSVSDLSLYDEAAVTYGAGDSITQSVTVSGSSALTLARDLSLTSGLTLSNGGSIVRTTETIAAYSFSVSDATLSLLAGDTFSPTGWSAVTAGGMVDTVAGSTLGSVSVTGTSAAGTRSTLTIDGNTAAGTIQAYGSGVVDLVSGTLAAQALLLTGTDSALRSGGSYDVDQLALAGGAALTYGVGDAIDNLSIDGAGSLLDSFEPLSLMSLSVTNGGLLRLNTFTGTGAVPNWGMRLAGDTVSYVQSLIAGNLLSGGSTPLAVFFDPGSNFTFVTPSSTPIPEIDPAAAGGAWTLLVGTRGLLERRKRRAGLGLPIG